MSETSRPRGSSAPGPRTWTFELPRGRRLEAGTRPLVVGILNCTPDSFSDGGLHARPEDAIGAGLRMLEEGADWLDIGGESTRPGSLPVAAEEQLRRILPVIRGLRKATEAPLSVDTMSPAVGAGALEAGADIVNDVGGFRDAGWRSVLGSRSVPLVVMHMRGTPLDMQVDPRYPEGVTRAVRAFFEERARELQDQGVSSSRLILDPGIGFGKRVQDNLELIRNIDVFKDLGYPVFIGASRKGFIEKVIGLEGAPADPDARSPAGHPACGAADPDLGTVIVNAMAIFRGADMLRVHNVRYARALVKMFCALRDGWAPVGDTGSSPPRPDPSRD